MTAPTEPTAPAATAPTSPVTPVPTPPGLAAPTPGPGAPGPGAATDLTTGTGPAEGDHDASKDPADGERKPGREAAGYRVKLREAEQQRDTLVGRVERMQRGEVARLAGRLAQPDDVLDLGPGGLGALLSDDGDVDPEKVSEAVDALLKLRPGLAVVAAQRMPDLGQGRREGKPGGSSWSSALRDRNGR